MTIIIYLCCKLKAIRDTENSFSNDDDYIMDDYKQYSLETNNDSLKRWVLQIKFYKIY